MESHVQFRHLGKMARSEKGLNSNSRNARSRSLHGEFEATDTRQPFKKQGSTGLIEMKRERKSSGVFRESQTVAAVKDEEDLSLDQTLVEREECEDCKFSDSDSDNEGTVCVKMEDSGDHDSNISSEENKEKAIAPIVSAGGNRQTSRHRNYNQEFNHRHFFIVSPETEAAVRFYKDLKDLIGGAVVGKAGSADENTLNSKGCSSHSTPVQSDNPTSTDKAPRYDLPKVHQVEHYHKYNLQVEYLTKTVSNHHTEKTMVKVYDLYSGDIKKVTSFFNKLDRLSSKKRLAKLKRLQKNTKKAWDDADDKMLMRRDSSSLLKKYSPSHVAKRREYVAMMGSVKLVGEWVERYGYVV